MNDKIETKLTQLPEIMLITLWAKAVENQVGRPLDKKIDIGAPLDEDQSYLEFQIQEKK